MGNQTAFSCLLRCLKERCVAGEHPHPALGRSPWARVSRKLTDGLREHGTSRMLLNVLNFYWTTDASPCCVRFFCTAKWISYMHTYLPSFLNFLPFRSPQNAEERSPCCIGGSHSSSIYTSVLSSPSSHPPRSPWYPHVCSLCLGLCFCFADKIIHTIFLDSTYQP